MEKFNVLDDKRFITGANSKFLFFKFEDGTEKRKEIDSISTDDLKIICDFFKSEVNFYIRMYNEIQKLYNISVKQFEKLHYFTDEEIQMMDWDVKIDCKLQNQKCQEKYYKSVGIFATSSEIFKKWKSYNELKIQIEKSIQKKVVMHND
jgi:hypothetical protein